MDRMLRDAKLEPIVPSVRAGTNAESQAAGLILVEWPVRATSNPSSVSEHSHACPLKRVRPLPEAGGLQLEGPAVCGRDSLNRLSV
jgi:hypothetical protein